MEFNFEFTESETLFLLKHVVRPRQQSATCKEGGPARCTKCLPACAACSEAQRDIDALIHNYRFMPVSFRRIVEARLLNPVPEPFSIESCSYYELTLTIPTAQDHAELFTGLRRLLSSKMVGMLSFEACLELTKKGVPHIHALIYSEKRYINASKLKYPHRFSCSAVRSVPQFRAYIYKYRGREDIARYCELFNLPQFFRGSNIDAIPTPKTTQAEKQDHDQDPAHSQG